MMKLQQLSFDNYFSMVVKLEDQAYNFLTNLGEEVSCLNEENKKLWSNGEQLIKTT